MNGKSRWLTLAALLLILLPPVWSALLVKDNLVNVPHYDDFTFLDDWVKYKKGELTWGDLFSVHLEHRVTVPRMIAIGLHIIGGPDIRWQNGMTFLLLGGTLWNLMVLWRRTMGDVLRAAWLPLFLVSALLFSPIQWQALLWPILFEIFIGVFAFTLLLRLWHSRMNPWLAVCYSTLLCAAATLSFGNGPITWLLTPFAIWFQRPDTPIKDRRRHIVTWLGISAVAFALYFTHYENSAPDVFSFEEDSKSNGVDTIKKFIFDPDVSALDKITRATDFTCAVIASHLVRGTSAHLLFTAQRTGYIISGLFFGALFWLFLRRRDADLLKRATPWVLTALYSFGSCMLIMLGRVSKTRSGDAAITQRYVSHGILLAVALIALAWIFGRAMRTKYHWLPMLGTLAAGALLMIEAIQWNYGSQRMEMWRDARLQGKALLMFSKKDLVPEYGFLGSVSGYGGLGAGLMQELDRLKQLPFPLLQSLDIDDHFHISKGGLLAKLGEFSELRLTPEGKLRATGYSELPTRRPADLVLFTIPGPNGQERIFGLTHLVRQPLFLYHNMRREHEWLSQGHSIGPDFTCAWEDDIDIFQMPPPGAPIKAWAMDVSGDKPRLYLVKDTRISPDPLPALPEKRKEPDLRPDAAR